MSQDQKPPPAEGSALWYKDAIIYEVARPRVQRLERRTASATSGGSIDKLDYLQDLGVTAVWLLPFYPSPLRDGGYDVADYATINPSLRDPATTFARLLREAHRRGHPRHHRARPQPHLDEHAWFQRARRARQGLALARLLRVGDTPAPLPGRPHHLQGLRDLELGVGSGRASVLLAPLLLAPARPQLRQPGGARRAVEVVDFWLELGVDGLRLDAVPYLYEREGTNCENLPRRTRSCEKLRAHIDAKFADRMLLAEANQWPADAAVYFGNGDECQHGLSLPADAAGCSWRSSVEDRFPIVDILSRRRRSPRPASGRRSCATTTS